MKEPARTINKDFLFYEDVSSLNQIDYGSFITIHNPLKQFPVQNLIIPEARVEPVCFKKLK